jgi:voltage-gated potassium channel
LIYLAVIVGLIILSGASAFYYFEHPTNPTVHGFWDAIWWAITTTATVGAGDVNVTTTGGRVVAIFLIFMGIGALGTFIAAIDTYVIRHEERLN